MREYEKELQQQQEKITKTVNILMHSGNWNDWILKKCHMLFKYENEDSSGTLQFVVDVVAAIYKCMWFGSSSCRIFSDLIAFAQN